MPISLGTTNKAGPQPDPKTPGQAPNTNTIAWLTFWGQIASSGERDKDSLFAAFNKQQPTPLWSLPCHR